MARYEPDLSSWEELAEKAGYDPTAFADLVNIPMRQLQRQLQKDAGRTPQDLLNELRIKKAQRLLLAGCLCKQAVELLHLKQVSHLSALFKRYAGMSPRQFIVDNRAEIRARRWTA